MKKLGRWLDRQTKERPFFSALIVLLIVIVPGYARLEGAVNTANHAANSANAAALSAADTAKQLSALVEQEAAQTKATALVNCQTRNTASKNGRDRFGKFFDALEAIFLASPDQTPEQRAQAQQFIENLRAGVPLDPEAEDVDCNGDGVLSERDYG